MKKIKQLKSFECVGATSTNLVNVLIKLHNQGIRNARFTTGRHDTAWGYGCSELYFQNVTIQNMFMGEDQFWKMSESGEDVWELKDPTQKGIRKYLKTFYWLFEDKYLQVVPA